MPRSLPKQYSSWSIRKLRHWYVYLQAHILNTTLRALPLVTNPASGGVSAQAVAKAPAKQAGAAGGAGGLLGGLRGGAGAGAGAAGAGGGGKLAGLLGAFGRRASIVEKRVVGSRIVERAQAGKWI